MTELFSAKAPFETRSYGLFTILVAPNPPGEDLVLVKGVVAGKSNVLCRVASSCVTSTALDAGDCDCAGQLAAAMSLIEQAGSGILIYAAQEGRGLGIEIKVQAMNNKARGYDTFAAVEALGLPAEGRSYGHTAQILDALGVQSVTLLTNNPDKVTAIRAAGVQVGAVAPCLADDPPAGAQRHLAAKQGRGHTL